MLPSVVRFDDRGVVERVGHEAKRDAERFPTRTISSVKRLMGRSIKDASDDLAVLPFTVVEGPGNTARVRLPLADGSSKVVSPQEVSAAVLRALRERARAALGVEIQKAVITVPAYFDDAQRQATRDAARLAGLEAVRIINEPTAAALAYGLGLRASSAGTSSRAQTIAVYDLGGGTFDVSVLRITPGSEAGTSTVSDFFQVLATAGDTHLGGDDMDAAIVAWLLRHASADGRARAEVSPELKQRLKAAAESAKVALSDAASTRITLELDDQHGLDLELTRDEFERLIEPLVQRTLESCARVLRDAKVRLPGPQGEPAHQTQQAQQDERDELSAVILVGGATRTPMVRERVRRFFKLTPYTALNPDEVVALGAAVQASVLDRAGKGEGAARSLLLDVLPLSLGIETVGGAMAKLVMRNSTVPARASEIFSTSVDNQTGIKINVLQGEREMAADCRLLGAFELKGIPAMPAGIPQLRVDFLVDASGVLTVRAAELRSGKALEAQVVPNHGLTRDEVERMERESYAHAREDMTRHRVVDLIAHTKFDLGMIERQMQRVGGLLDAPSREGLEGAMRAVREQIATAQHDWRGVNPDEFQRAKEAMDRASVRLHEVSIAQSLKGTKA